MSCKRPCFFSDHIRPPLCRGLEYEWNYDAASGSVADASIAFLEGEISCVPPLNSLFKVDDSVPFSR